LARTTQTNLLRKKGEFTKFQILLEIMRNQPNVKQKDISEVIGITVQAVSKYFHKLMREGLVEAGSERADYRLTPKAIEKLSEYLENLERYVTRIKNDLKIQSVWPAMATRQIKAGDETGLIMKGGVLCAVSPKHPDAEAFGTAAADASPGEEVCLKNVRGEVKLRLGKILIVKIPSIREGGSRAVDLAMVQKLHETFKPDRTGAMETVGEAVLNKLGIKPNLEFVSSESVALAALRGLNVFVLVGGRMVNQIVEELDQISIEHAMHIMYEVKEGRSLWKNLKDSSISIPASAYHPRYTILSSPADSKATTISKKP